MSDGRLKNLIKSGWCFHLLQAVDKCYEDARSVMVDIKRLNEQDEETLKELNRLYKECKADLIKQRDQAIEEVKIEVGEHE